MAGKPAARVQVKGAKEFRAAMKAAQADLRDLTATNKAAAAVVAKEAINRAPILSGDLAGSIRAKGTRTTGRVLAGSNAIPYAGVIHFGWPAHGISPNPFLYEAADDRTDEVIDVYNARIEDIVKKIDRMTPDV